MATNGSMHTTVRLNVGGTLYEVSRDTLERCEGTMLANLVSDKWKEGNSDGGPIFIDRNGRLFEFVLDYLRMNKVYLPPSVSRAAVEEEFKYYGIEADTSKVNEKYGFEYSFELLQKIQAQQKGLDVLKREALAIQASAEAQLAFLQSNSLTSTVSVRLSYAKFSSLLDHENLLRECLLAKGLDYVSSKRELTAKQNTGISSGMTFGRQTLPDFAPNDSLLLDVKKASS